MRQSWIVNRDTASFMLDWRLITSFDPDFQFYDCRCIGLKVNKVEHTETDYRILNMNPLFWDELLCPDEVDIF
jgi:hypothetical protein